MNCTIPKQENELYFDTYSGTCKICNISSCGAECFNSTIKTCSCPADTVYLNYSCTPILNTTCHPLCNGLCTVSNSSDACLSCNMSIPGIVSARTLSGYACSCKDGAILKDGACIYTCNDTLCGECSSNITCKSCRSDIEGVALINGSCVCFEADGYINSTNDDGALTCVQANLIGVSDYVGYYFDNDNKNRTSVSTAMSVASVSTGISGSNII